MSLNSQQRQECCELVRLETQLFLDELYDLKRLDTHHVLLARALWVLLVSNMSTPFFGLISRHSTLKSSTNAERQQDCF